MKYENTSKRLKIALSNKNLTAQELADKSGVSKASISQYVNGSHAPSNVSSSKIAPILDVNPLWLMGFDVDMNIEWNPKTQEISVEEHSMDKKYNQLIDRMKSNKDFEEIIFEYADMMYKRFEKE